MRNVSLGSVAFSVLTAAILSSASATAADLPRRSEPYTPAAAYSPSVTDWTGFYVGLNAGFAVTGRNHNGVLPSGAFLAPAAFPAGALPAISGNSGNTGTKFTGGFQAGYNYQMGNGLVLGLEGDVNYRNRNRSGAFATAFAPLPGAGPFTGANGFAYLGQNRSEWFGTIRPRIGVALDRALPYLTGGLALAGGGSANVAQITTGLAPTGGPFIASSSSKTTGWALGGGIEYAFTSNISAKAEYLYVSVDHGSRLLVNPVNPGYFFINRNEDRMHVVRAGVNYRFGNAFGGVFAQ